MNQKVEAKLPGNLRRGRSVRACKNFELHVVCAGVSSGGLVDVSGDPVRLAAAMNLAHAIMPGLHRDSRPFLVTAHSRMLISISITDGDTEGFNAYFLLARS